MILAITRCLARRGVRLLAFGCCLAVCAAARLLAAEETTPLNLLADRAEWSGSPDRPSTQQSVEWRGDVLTTEISGDGGDEDYPKVTRSFAAPQDWSRYARLCARVRITSDDPDVREKNLTFVILDERNRRLDLPDRPMTQQCLGHTVPVGQWVDLRDWLDGVDRTAVRGLSVYLYEVPPAKAHRFRWEIASLRLESGIGAFDGEPCVPQAPAGQPSAPAGELVTPDGLRLTVGQRGDLSALAVGSERVGIPDGATPTGILVRDVTTDSPPVAAGGRVRRQGSALRQTATVPQLGLSIDATYRVWGNAIEVRGTVADRRGTDRAITLYFAVPVAEAPWRWWDSASQWRTASGQTAELACYEVGRDYGLEGRHSKYPMGALTWPGHAGLTLAIRMDEPVVHRIFYNPRLRLFTIAFDFGLVPEKRVRGRPLSEAPFRVLLYRHDPAWGMRSALQRYYRLFPQFFVKRAKREGGWYVWGHMKDTPGAVEAGFGFHWGPANDAAVQWDNQHGILAVYYIESEFHQQTMGDYDRAPTVTEVMERLRKLADGDPETTAAVEKLSYGYARSGREFLRAISRATFASAFHDAQGRPYCQIGQLPWIGESNWGAIIPCNLDPDIPEGKGWFNHRFMLRKLLSTWGSRSARYDGIALDSLGGYGQWSRVSYRRDHFRYSDFPLSFSSLDRRPVQVAAFATLEWVRALARDVHARGKVLMANCSWHTTPAWLTFAAPYLDVFGAEAPRFADPDFIRAIVYRKPCTDLPYTPQPEWDAHSRLLHGIYLGHGHDLGVMRRCIGALRALAAAGWEPITGARVQPATVRLERYGHGSRILLVAHNADDATVQADVILEPGTLGLPPARPVRATPVFPEAGEPQLVQNGRVRLTMAGRQTLVLALSPQ